MPTGLATSAAPSDGAPTADGRDLDVRQIDLRTSIRPTVAEIDLPALRRNVERVRRAIGPGVAIYGVVKADAYGHGAIPIARALAPMVDALAVSLVEEGLELRDAGIDAPIIVLAAYYDGTHADVLEAGLLPVVYDAADLERFARAPLRRRAAVERDRLGPPRRELHLKVDTGMSRLGLPADTAAATVDRARALPGLEVSGLCTHLACADADDPGPTFDQLACFDRVIARTRAAGFAPRVLHAANSAAAFRFPAARYGAVRPGLALYGAMPSAAVARPELEPVLSLRTRIMAIRDVPVGAAVSYGARFRASRPSRIATLPIGYADGYPRHVASAEVLVGGRRAPIAGAVCMDMLMIDVTDCPAAAIDSPVTLLGRDEDDAIGVDQLAAWAGTANYEILCGISKRVPRLYRDDTPERDARDRAVEP